MAGLDSKYVLAPSLQSFFIDKDTALPLTGGKIWFYQNGTNVPKAVYEISGVSPDITYVALPNPVELSAVGTFQDNSGNDIIPYYHPYDDDGNIELYSIAVYDSNDVLQFTRDNWPNTIASDLSTDNDITNFVPNGQFLLHNDVPASSANGYVAGQISADEVNVAQGGWYIVRSTGSTAVDNITFTDLNVSAVSSLPDGDPPYALHWRRTTPSNDARTDLCIRYPNANTFASSTQVYNLYFNGKVVTGSDTTVEIFIRKYYGTGGSASVETSQGTVTITTDYSSTGYNVQLLFGSNSGKTIASDSYVEVIVRQPLNNDFNLEYTNFFISLNDDTLSDFPPQAPFDQMDSSTAGYLPSPASDGSDLYLPIIYGKNGFDFDDSEIGKLRGGFNTTAINNELICDGSQYFTRDYSSLGIPYQRLFTRLYDSTNKVPQFGTGANYATASVLVGDTSLIYLGNNKTGTQTNAANGAMSPGFTFAIYMDGATNTDFKAGVNNSTLVTAICNTVGSPFHALGAGTSTLTVGDVYNNSFVQYVFNVTAKAAASLAAGAGNPGLYFEFSNTATRFYVWFQVTTETDPAPFVGTGIKCGLNPNFTAADVAIAIANALAGYKTTGITCVAASTPINTGSYFSFYANSQQYVVWYNVASAGGEPSVSGAINIEVAVGASDTAATVADLTRVAINSAYFAVPDMRGIIPRGYDSSLTWDKNAATSRFGQTIIRGGNNVATLELDTNRYHTHTATLDGVNGAPTAPPWASALGTFTAVQANISGVTISGTGSNESVPVNMAVNWYIKY